MVASAMKASRVVSSPNMALPRPFPRACRPPASLLLLHRLEGVGEPCFLAVVAGAVPERGAADTGRDVLADDAALRVLALDVVEHEVLRDDHVAFHADHLGDVGDAAGAVAQAGGLDDDVDRADDDFAHGLLR